MEMYGSDSYTNTLSALNSIEFELYTQKLYKWQFCVMYIFPQFKKKKKKKTQKTDIQGKLNEC